MGKCAYNLFNCISVTDDIQINHLYKSIATRLLYVCPKFDVFSTLVHVREEMGNSNPLG